jgi:hypothetical protein
MTIRYNVIHHLVVLKENEKSVVGSIPPHPQGVGFPLTHPMKFDLGVHLTAE